VKALRSLVGCLNAFGGLDPLGSMLLSLTDDQLEPLVSVANNYVIDKPKVLFQIEQTYRTLEKNGALDQAIASFGSILQNDESVTALAQLLKAGYYDASGRSDQGILRALDRLARYMTPYDHAVKLLDLGLGF